jgi:hypothetical protein
MSAFTERVPEDDAALSPRVTTNSLHTVDAAMHGHATSRGAPVRNTPLPPSAVYGMTRAMRVRMVRTDDREYSSHASV